MARFTVALRYGAEARGFTSALPARAAGFPGRIVRGRGFTRFMIAGLLAVPAASRVPSTTRAAISHAGSFAIPYSAGD